jgi:hypothetical protein
MIPINVKSLKLAHVTLKKYTMKVVTMKTTTMKILKLAQRNVTP